MLADGVAYAAKDLNCDIVLDMATLTGAQGIATGRYHASHMSNDDGWEKALSSAGRASGDLSFPAVRNLYYSHLCIHVSADFCPAQPQLQPQLRVEMVIFSTFPATHPYLASLI